MFDKFLEKFYAFYTAHKFYAILLCLTLGLILGFIGSAAFSTTAVAQPVQAQAQSTHPWKFVDHDNFRPVSQLNYEDYLRYNRGKAMSEAGVVKVKGQVPDSPGAADKKAALEAAGKIPQNVIAIDQQDADACMETRGLCALLSPKALAILNEKLEQLEKAQKKGAACI